MISIIKHYFQSFITQLDMTCQDPTLSKKDILIQAIAHQCNLVMENKDFWSMQVKVIVATPSEEIQQLCLDQSLLSLAWFQTQIIQLYGPEVEPHAIDLASMLNGMLKEYFFSFICFHHPINVQELSVYLVERLDDLVQGIFRKKDAPILKASCIFKPAPVSNEDMSLQAHFEELKQNITTQVTDPVSAQSMLVAVQALEAELCKGQPNNVIIQGMFTYLQSLSEPYPQLVQSVAWIASKL